MLAKIMVADLNKREKLDGDNYDIWHWKIQYLLDKQGVLKNLRQIMQEPEAGNIAQHWRDLEAYQNWRKKDRCARFTMLYSMHNDFLSKFEQYATASEMWQALTNKYVVVSSTKLYELNMKFNIYKKKAHHWMK